MILHTVKRNRYVLSFYISECVKPYRKHYGETFEHSIPENGSVLEFSPWGALPDAEPVVLWNRTNLETAETGRGRLLRGGKFWVAERVTQADQGNYTVRDDNGKVLSRSTLSVRGEQRHICFLHSPWHDIKNICSLKLNIYGNKLDFCRDKFVFY